jgi:hypothetical protein
MLVIGYFAEAIGVKMDWPDTRGSCAGDIGLDRVADVNALIG